MPAYIVYNKKTGVIIRQGFSVDPSGQIDQKTEEFFLTEKDLPNHKVDLVTKKIIPSRSKTTVASILTFVHESDEILNAEIAKITPDVNGWRIQNYSVLRYNTYPPIVNSVDAQVKLSSSDPVITAQGQAQMDEYCSACLAVKLRFPRSI